MIARIPVAGVFWRQMGEKFTAPLPPDYQVVGHENDLRYDVFNVVISVARSVEAEVNPVYGLGSDDEIRLLYVIGDPMYPEVTA